MHLLDLEDDSLVLTLCSCSHQEVCRSKEVSTRLARLARSQHVWKQQYLRFVHQAAAPRLVLERAAAVVDWSAAFRRLNPAWDDALFTADNLCWHHLGATPPGVGGQDPKVLALGEDRYLVLAGASFNEPQGGLLPVSKPEAYLLEAAEIQVSWKAIRVSGDAPRSIHGSYCGVFGSDGVTGDRILSFGGGSHVAASDCVGCLDLRGLHTEEAAVWSVLAGERELQQVMWFSDGDEIGLETPSPRYAGGAVSYGGALVTFSGRTGGVFHNMQTLWCFDLQSNQWCTWDMSGEAPSARVHSPYHHLT